jgi:hydroxymethylglutaryl-CoA lyase
VNGHMPTLPPGPGAGQEPVALGAADLGLPPRIDIREVGMRDGLQIEEPIPTSAKMELLTALVSAGAHRIEVTGFVSPRAVPALADADRVAATLDRFPGVRFSALVANVRGAQRALDAGLHDVEYVVSAADGHSRANTRRSTSEALDDVAAVAEAVHGQGGTCEVILATAWDCPFDGPTPPERVTALARRAVELGADRLCLGDTIGTTTPRRMAHLVRSVRGAAPGVPLGLHLHNTRGAALATLVIGLQLGITEVDASIGGLGGCPFAPGASGNLATEDLVFLCEESGIATDFSPAGALEAARLAEQLVGRRLSSGVLRAGLRGSPEQVPQKAGVR